MQSTNCYEDETNLQRTVDNLLNHMADKGLHINAAKCQFTTISESTVPYILTSPPSISGVPIQHSNTLDYLGVTIDSKINWGDNTRRKTAKAKQAIGCIRRLVKNQVPRHQLEVLLKLKVLPIFMYGAQITYPRTKGGRIQLERLNRYVARLVTNDFESAYLDLLTQTHMQPVCRSVLHRRIALAKKYASGLRYIPPNCLRAFNQQSSLRRRYHDGAVVVVNATGLRYHDSALELSTEAWNRLPNDLAGTSDRTLLRRLDEVDYSDPVWSAHVDLTAALRLL
jgi:hypothetical protein